MKKLWGCKKRETATRVSITLLLIPFLYSPFFPLVGANSEKKKGQTSLQVSMKLEPLCVFTLHDSIQLIKAKIIAFKDSTRLNL